MNINGISTTQLAKICGVSQGTVDRALNNRKGINKNTKEKVLAIAKEYGYRPNLPVKENFKTIGVILPDLSNSEFIEYADKLQKAASEKGYSTVVSFNSQNAEKEIKSILSLYHMGVVGLVFAPLNNGEDFKKFLWSLDLPVLTLNEVIDSIPPLNLKEGTDLAVEISLEYIIDGKPLLDTVEI